MGNDLDMTPSPDAGSAAAASLRTEAEDVAYEQGQADARMELARSRLNHAAAGEAPCAAAVSSNQSASPPVQMEAVDVVLNGRKATLSGVALEVMRTLEKAAAIDAKSAFERGYTGGLGFARGVCDEHQATVEHVRKRIDANLSTFTTSPVLSPVQMEAVARIFEIDVEHYINADDRFRVYDVLAEHYWPGFYTSKMEVLAAIKESYASPVPSSERDDIIASLRHDMRRIADELYAVEENKEATVTDALEVARESLNALMHLEDQLCERRPKSSERDDIDVLQREVSGLTDENERLRAERDDIIEMCAKVADRQSDRMQKLIDQGKGQHGSQSYVRDDTWQYWLGEHCMATCVAAAIRSLKSQPAQSGEATP